MTVDPLVIAAVAVGAALAFLVVQHLAVLKMARLLHNQHRAIVAIAKGEAKVRLDADGRIEIRGV